MPKLERRGLIDALTEEERRGALRRYGNLVKLDLIALLSERDETLDALRNLERAHRRERERAKGMQKFAEMQVREWRERCLDARAELDALRALTQRSEQVNSTDPNGSGSSDY